MKKDQVINCILQSWYPKFKQITVESRIIDIPDTVLDYLQADGLVLLANDSKNVDADRCNTSDDETDWGSETEEGVNCPDISSFTSAIEKAISDLGGAVMPKLNWSSPKDAVWISHDKSMKCATPNEVLLLIKSSDFISHDLTDPFEGCDDVADHTSGEPNYHLVLRKWIDILPQSEFRCFVVGNQLCGISQRNDTCYYPSLASEKDAILDDIKKFFTRRIEKRFQDDDYVFDVFRNGQDGIVLIDFNLFGPTTDCLLFSWEELCGIKQNGFEVLYFRTVTTREGIQPDPYQCYSIPQDFLHLASGLDPNKFLDFVNFKKNQVDDDED